MHAADDTLGACCIKGALTNGQVMMVRACSLSSSGRARRRHVPP